MPEEEYPRRSARVAGPQAPRGDREWQEQVAAQRAQFQRVVDDANATIRDLRAFLRDTEARLERAQEDLRSEVRARESAEAEVESLKKGAQNMIKYVSGLQRKKHEEEVRFLTEQLEALQREVTRAKATAIEANEASSAGGGGSKAAAGGRGRLGRRGRR